MAKRNLLIIILLLGVSLIGKPLVALSNSAAAFAECPPASISIWVQGQGNVFPENEVVQVPFEIGTFDYESTTLTNYLAGVLEQEIGGTAETALSDWQEETAKTVAVAARTAAYAGCYREIVNGQHGVYEDLPQVYNPGHSDPRAQDHRDFVEQTAGQYLSHPNVNDSYFDVQYRTYVGQQTNARAGEEEGGPHKSVPDPVGSADEDTGTGMGQHSANHWILGQHNTIGCAGGAIIGCNRNPPADWQPNVLWSDYRQLLVHYYTGVQVRDTAANVLTSNYRWNLLEHQLDSPPLPDTWNNATVIIQNTGTQPIFSSQFALFGAWCRMDDSFCPTRQQLLDSLPHGIGFIDVGNTFTLTEIYGPPDGSTYRLVWDICTFAGPQRVEEHQNLQQEDNWCFSYPPEGQLAWVRQEVGVFGSGPNPTRTPTLPSNTATPPSTEEASPTPTLAGDGTPTATPTANTWSPIENIILQGEKLYRVQQYSEMLSALRDTRMLGEVHGQAYVDLT